MRTVRKVTRSNPHVHTPVPRKIDWTQTEGCGLSAAASAVWHYTNGWGAYERHIDPEQHEVGKEHTQKIESKHINLQTRIKRLVRRTICFSKTEEQQDLS